MKTVKMAISLSILASLNVNASKDVLNVGMGSADVGKLDPHIATATPDVGLLNWMFNGLVRIKPGESNSQFIEPDIAKSWTSSEDGLTWNFALREDVNCHGKYGSLDADDVVYSLNRASDPKKSSFSGDFSSFESVKAVNNYEVEIKLKEKIPSLLGLLTPYHGGNIVCKDAVEELGEKYVNTPIGTGPFMFSEYQPQQYVKLVSNPEYFRGEPKIKEINYKYIPSDASRDLAFQSGELDMMYGKQDQTWIDRIAKVPGTTVKTVLPGEMATLHLNSSLPPLDNLKVRQAIAYAVDKKALVELKGSRVTLPSISPVPEGYLGYSDELEEKQYNSEMAKQLLEEAGYKDGIELTAIVSSLPSIMDTMQAVQALLKRSNIDLKIEAVEHATFHEQIRKNLSQVVFYAAARFPIADVYLTQFYHSDSIVGKESAITNFSHCSVADSEIEAARRLSGEAQLDAWKEAQQKILSDVCSVPLYQRPQLWAWKDNLDFGVEVKGALSLSPPVTEKTEFK